MPCAAGEAGSIDHPPQGPGAGGQVAAQLVDARGEALPGRGLYTPEIKLGLLRDRVSLPPPLAVDRPVLKDRPHRVQPPAPYEPGRPAILAGLDLYRLAIHPAHVLPRLPPHRQHPLAPLKRDTRTSAPGGRQATYVSKSPAQ